ncbi:MAG: hypothetical protein EG825_10265 [Rhodocyclaceae bacterium]|nr:hypothetical protein [Rhodocyclaceae bacterium]
MHNKEILILAALGVGLFYLMNKARAGGVKGAAQTGTGTSFIREWQGWRYYTDGTVIGPDGTYYKDGNPIWWPTMAGGVAA